MRIVPGPLPTARDRDAPRDGVALATDAAKGAPRVLPPRWRNLLLVCGECEDRSKGPKAGTAKKLAKAIGSACRSAGLPRPRRLVTDCMGACPKKACTVAGIDARGRTTLLAMKRGDDADAAVRLLYAAAEPAPAAGPTLPPLAAADASPASNSTSSAPSDT